MLVTFLPEKVAVDSLVLKHCFQVNFSYILLLIKTLRKTVALSINRKFPSGLLRKSVESVSEK